MTTAEAVALTAPTLAVVVSHVIERRKLAQIHLLVNSRLEEALREIAALKARLLGHETWEHLSDAHGVGLRLENMHEFDHRPGVPQDHSH